ncbi:hypothetical protein HGG64_02720 [Mycoplasma phocoeninasale]|uniref:Uncharacterized protein n=1 Tax=Mycoplasma phocoeninasale TaxID=2726117 RepID=A0A858U731_9MOLU|nr:hypothetical protein [Mycoplasma phocoeninasale]QJG66598.1 hypothetical protein HGG64_02720 [Mycoplasma phocoeninasale]
MNYLLRNQQNLNKMFNSANADFFAIEIIDFNDKDIMAINKFCIDNIFKGVNNVIISRI